MAQARKRSTTGKRGSTNGSTGDTVKRAASAAKGPLLAGGAALAGAAGGMAIGVRRGRRRSKVDLGKAAENVGAFGAQMGQLASALQQGRETADGPKRRSPIEVVLEGLTARR
jgi:hypothetical protein